MSASAFRASYSDWRLVKTRGVVQCVFEVPLADADKAYEVLGGMPNSANERWFGIAALKQEAPGKGDRTCEPETASPRLPSHAKRSFRDLPPQQQAGMRINEAAFGEFLKENYPDEWHETGDADGCLKMICGIESKRELQFKHASRVLWNCLNEKYEAWKVKEHA